MVFHGGNEGAMALWSQIILCVLKRSMNIDGRVMKDSVVKMFNVCLVGLERKVVAAFLLGVDSLRGLTGDGHACSSG